jgi:DNA polymerase-1
VGPRRGAQLFDGLEFRVLRDRLFETWASEEEIDESGFDVAGAARPGEVAAGWPSTPAHGPRVGVHVRGPLGRRAPATSGGRAGRGRRHAAWSTSAADLDPRTSRRWPPGWPTRPAQGRCTTPRARCSPGRARLAARGGLTSDTALAAYLADARPALLRPGRPHAALPQARAAPGRRPTTGSSSPRRLGRRRRGADSRDAARPRGLDLADALDTELEAEAAAPRCWPTSSCRWSTCWPDGAQTGIAVDVDHLERSRPTSPDRGEARADEALRVIGKEINLGSPKQLQVVLFDELGMPKTKRTKTGYTTDADALQALSRPSTRS